MLQLVYVGRYSLLISSEGRQLISSIVFYFSCQQYHHFNGWLHKTYTHVFLLKDFFHSVSVMEIKTERQIFHLVLSSNCCEVQDKDKLNLGARDSIRVLNTGDSSPGSSSSGFPVIITGSWLGSVWAFSFKAFMTTGNYFLIVFNI